MMITQKIWTVWIFHGHLVVTKTLISYTNIIIIFLIEVRVIPQDFKKLGITSLFWDG